MYSRVTWRPVPRFPKPPQSTASQEFALKKGNVRPGQYNQISTTEKSGKPEGR